jgi:Spx/MgsR family transcriptional regulator
MKLFGIANCDTVRKARAWLDARGVGYAWVDFRKAPPAVADVTRWSRATGWEALLNRRGTTWRGLDDATKARVVDEATAVALMTERPTLIRRPVVEHDGAVVVGFDENDYDARFGRHARPTR